MTDIKRALMEGQGMSDKEADETITELKEGLAECNYDPEESEELMLDYGLEMDFLLDLI